MTPAGDTSLAEQAGIDLRDAPAPLFQLLVLVKLASARIRSANAAQGMRGLLAAGWTTPDRLAATTWRERVTVLNQNGYARYDESAAHQLAALVELLQERYGGDLRRMRDAADSDPVAIARLVQEFPGIGPVGARIFLREVRAAWTDVAPLPTDSATRVASR